MQAIRIVLSFDHELSLGGARSYARNLFDPTARLLDLADEIEVPVALFTDVCASLRFREWDPAGYDAPYRAQITEAAARGHDVQLHLHPHWLDSTYENGTFVPSDSYTLAAFADRPAPLDIPGIVDAGATLLETLCRPARADYRCVAYRGGGFNLAPRTGEILRALYARGIRIDSSIGKGMQFRSRTNEVDYRSMPDAANWLIDPDGPLDRPADTGLLEVPVAAMPRTPLNNLPFLVKRVLHRRRRYASSGWSIIGEQSSARDRLARLVPRSIWYVSFDNHARSAGDVCAVLRDHLRRHRDDPVVYCASCSHPKTMGAYQRDVMRKFIDRTRQRYADAVRFVTFREIHDEVFDADGTPRPGALPGTASNERHRT